jgi:hypothetical protein
VPVLLSVLAGVLALAVPPPAPAAPAAAPEVHIAGNEFVDGAGRAFRLIGTTAAVGTAGACVEPRYGDPYRKANHSVAYGPIGNDQYALMRAWHMNTVRITLNEGCWLGLAPVRYRQDRLDVLTGRAGRRAAASVRKTYRRAIVSLVARAHAMGFVTIVDLHYSAPGSTLAFAQWPLPDHDHSPAFWRSVVKAFEDDRSMVFEVFNEPFDKAGRVTWDCLRNGCRLPNLCADCDRPVPGCPATRCPYPRHKAGFFRAAGMQELVDVIRKAGATQPLLVPGRAYSNDLSEWLVHRPDDPLGQIGATFHFYGDSRYDNGCVELECWEATIRPVAAEVPVSATEFGQFDCGHDFMDSFQGWADVRGVSYQAFGWYVADFPPCSTTEGGPPQAPAMLLDYQGTPTTEGEGFKAHLEQLHAAGELP